MVKLSRALRISRTSSLALVGAGGKTSALIQLAREMAPSWVTTTTHLGVWQVDFADKHVIIEPDCKPWQKLEKLPLSGITLVTGPAEDERFVGVPRDVLCWLRESHLKNNIPLLIEADGSRQKPIKAPAEHEPVIPNFVDVAVVVVGLSALGKPVSDDWVHRLECFERVGAAEGSSLITSEMVASMLLHPEGGLKNIPAHARRIALLNQADTPELQSSANNISHQLLPGYHSAVITSLKDENVLATHEPVAGIILAAGGAFRFGESKQILEWHGKPMVHHIAEIALAAGLSPVILVSGAYSEEVEGAVRQLPISIIHNPEWFSGQSSSIKAGVSSLPEGTGAVIFLLADQPQITPVILRALVERHSLDLSTIIAPQVQGQRANPVLFDQSVFPDLLSLLGDVGGRQLFSKYLATYLPWHDERLLMDIDTNEDYNTLIQDDG